MLIMNYQHSHPTCLRSKKVSTYHTYTHLRYSHPHVSPITSGKKPTSFH